MTRSIIKWSDESDAELQHCFASTDWNMFWDSSDGIEEYTTSVIGFINNCIDDVIPTVTVRTVHTPTRNYGLQATSALRKRLELLVSRSGTLTRKPIRNPVLPSDEPSNRQSVNTCAPSSASRSPGRSLGCTPVTSVRRIMTLTCTQ